MSHRTLADLDWAHRPLGRAVRIGLAATGMIASFFFLILAGSASTGVWILVVGGAALAATSVRAAWFPSRARLVALLANLAVIPLFIQVI